MDNKVSIWRHPEHTMKRPLLFSLLLALNLVGSVGSVAWAQGGWRDLPPDERRQMRQQMRDHWQQMPPEQRQLIREERRERRERHEAFQQMPPEDRYRLREEMRGRPGDERGPR